MQQGVYQVLISHISWEEIDSNYDIFEGIFCKGQTSIFEITVDLVAKKISHCANFSREKISAQPLWNDVKSSLEETEIQLLWEYLLSTVWKWI